MARTEFSVLSFCSGLSKRSIRPPKRSSISSNPKPEDRRPKAETTDVRAALQPGRSGSARISELGLFSGLGFRPWGFCGLIREADHCRPDVYSPHPPPAPRRVPAAGQSRRDDRPACVAVARCKPPHWVLRWCTDGVRIVYGWCTDIVRMVYAWCTQPPASHLLGRGLRPLGH